MRIKSIKRLDNGHTEIKTQTHVDDDWKTNGVDSPEQPIQSFNEALQEFRAYVREECRLSPDSVDEIEVTGVIYKYKGDDGQILRFQVLANLPSKNTDAPIKLKTPSRVIYSDNENTEAVADRWATATDVLNQEAERYLNGEFAQPELEMAEDGEGEPELAGVGAEEGGEG